MNAEPALSQRPLVVHMCRQFPPGRGGLEDVVFNLCRQLLARGYRVRVVTLDRLFSEPHKVLPAREQIEGIEVVRIPWSGSSRYPLAPGVLAHLRDADLVHVHAVDFFFDALAWLKPLHGKPMVATTHGGFFHTRKFALIKQLWFRSITRVSTLGYRQLICCSTSDTHLFKALAGPRTVTIENGADLSKFAGCSSPAPARRIVTIGRFSVNKRLENLIQAMAPLVRREPQFQLDIVGVESDLTKERLEALIREAGVGPNVTLHIGLPNADVANLMRQASLFASASEYEGFGLVAIEAMSAGLLPVLNSNEAYRQLAERHPVFEMTDFTNPDMAAAAIAHAFARVEAGGPALRQQLMNEARPYNWDTVAGHYARAYERAVPGITRFAEPVAEFRP